MTQTIKLSDSAIRKRKERERKKKAGIVYVQVIAFKEDSILIKKYAKKLFDNK